MKGRKDRKKKEGGRERRRERTVKAYASQKPEQKCLGKWSRIPAVMRRKQRTLTLRPVWATRQNCLKNKSISNLKFHQEINVYISRVETGDNGNEELVHTVTWMPLEGAGHRGTRTGKATKTELST